MRNGFGSSWLVSLALILVGCGNDDSKPWVGKTFLLDTPNIDASRWTKPSGALTGSIANYGVPQFLFSVGSGSGDNLAITLAAAQDGLQDGCIAT